MTRLTPIGTFHHLHRFYGGNTFTEWVPKPRPPRCQSRSHATTSAYLRKPPWHKFKGYVTETKGSDAHKKKKRQTSGRVGDQSRDKGYSDCGVLKLPKHLNAASWQNLQFGSCGQQGNSAHLKLKGLLERSSGWLNSFQKYNSIPKLLFLVTLLATLLVPVLSSKSPLGHFLEKWTGTAHVAKGEDETSILWHKYTSFLNMLFGYLKKKNHAHRPWKCKNHRL